MATNPEAAPASVPVIGQPAPDFVLPVTRGSLASRGVRRLLDFRGRWLVLVFYPRDFSLLCPTELSSMSERLAEFAALDADILGVSRDTLGTHELWMSTPRDEGGVGPLAFPLASDLDAVAMRAYGVYWESNRIALRGLYVIDPRGNVQFQTVHSYTVARRPEDTLRVIAALQSGGLCDPRWTPDRPPLDADALKPGQMASHYRIERQLGEGGFARVFLAHDTVLERKVALKVLKLRDGLVAGDALREARLAAALNHPNVCTVFNVDDSEGLPIIVMECLTGQPLATLVAGRPLPAAHAARIATQVADGMAAAHAQGIVHGDLKPANVFVTDDGVAKILDFGIARRLRSLASDVPSGGVDACTGSPRYMSPEQLTGRPTGSSSDIFGLGLVLCELLTGTPVVGGATLREIVDAIRSLDGEAQAAVLPPPFRALVASCLRQDPAARPSMREVSAQLRQVAE